jgi:hypothetical protein
VNDVRGLVQRVFEKYIIAHSGSDTHATFDEATQAELLRFKAGDEVVAREERRSGGDWALI